MIYTKWFSYGQPSFPAPSLSPTSRLTTHFPLSRPHDAKEVIVTGTFDQICHQKFRFRTHPALQIPKTSFVLQWSRSVRLSKGENGFSATARVPWGEKVLYRFIVDGRWTTIDNVPTEVDQRGNINNIYYTPAKPQEVDAPRCELPAVQQPMMSPIPASAPEEDDLEISLSKPRFLLAEPRISIISAPIPATEASFIPALVPVERLPSPMISLTRDPVSVGEEEDPFAAKSSLVKKQGKSASKSSLRWRDRFISKLKHLFTLEED